MQAPGCSCEDRPALPRGNGSRIGLVGLLRRPDPESDESREVAAGRDLDPKFARVSGLQIVLRETFPNVTRGAANDMVDRRVVVRRAAEYLYPNISLFEMLGIAIEGPGYNVRQEIRTSLAPPESGTGQQTPELFADGSAILFRFRRPGPPIGDGL